MAYSEFTLKDIEQKVHLEILESADLFPAAPEAVPSTLLTNLLHVYTPLALAINTEKARSELLIAPLLVDVREQLQHSVNLFSGVDFTVDAAKGLNGACDFILSRSPQQQFIDASVMAIVEARTENLKSGFGQCVAAMLAVRLFNEHEGHPVDPIFGGVTTGTLWRFLTLAANTVTLDQQEYHIKQTGKILGILLHLLRT